VIVIDDGSDDDTEAKVAAIQDPKIRFDRIAHGGPSVARNRGIEISHGEFVAFLDSDDIWYPTKLERQLTLFDRSDLGWTYTNLDYEGEQGPEPDRFERKAPCRGWVLRSLFLEGFPMLTSSVMVRKSCLDHVGVFDPDLLRWQDNDLYIRLARHCQVDYVSDSLGRYWHRPRSRSTSHILGSRRRQRIVKARAMQLDPELRNCHRGEMRKAYLNNLMGLARLELVLGDVAEARRLYSECIAFDPRWWKPRAGLLTTYLPAGVARSLISTKPEWTPSASDQTSDAGMVAQERSDQSPHSLGQ
jgi:glycosyltransferase involved in cell wall biosynthesis